MNALDELVDDLAAEHAALDLVLARMPERAWDIASHAPGWLARDQITHLAHFDEAATRAVVEPAAFRAEVSARAAAADRATHEERYLAAGRAMRPASLRDWWLAAGQTLVAILRKADPGARLPWYGPDMSAASFVTARLMETWSHGLDVVDVVGVERPDTDRLRHVVFLGVRTRSFSYANRGLPPNEAPVFVRLVAPSGAVWTYGDPGAPDRIDGTAADFCRVVTQRRHLADTRLTVTGPNAGEWMAIAQAFAGPPGPGRRAGEFPLAAVDTPIR
jgi:uncharacterized protein (TIGR03084 family)